MFNQNPTNYPDKTEQKKTQQAVWIKSQAQEQTLNMLSTKTLEFVQNILVNLATQIQVLLL